MTATHTTHVIAYPGDQPPRLVPAPADYRGLVWRYADATPAAARRALAEHRAIWPDWAPDDHLLALAGGDPPDAR